MYDLLITQGTVVDPTQNIYKKMDVAVRGGSIAALADHIPQREARRIVDASGQMVTPGLIDAHCHVYAGVQALGVEPDSAGVRQAVTTVNDGGSAGHAVFGGFPAYVIPSTRTSVFCFLHLSSTGLSVMPELNDWGEINPDAIAATVEAHPHIIKGIKLRQVGRLFATSGTDVITKAKEIAARYRFPIMFHIGDPDKQVPARVTRETLPLMQAGDILTHVYTPQQGNVFDEHHRIIPELKEAQARGVVIDTCPGRSNFSFELASRCLDQDILPTFIATDLSAVSIHGPVYGLTHTMSVLMQLGLTLNQLIDRTTISPARILGLDHRKGSLKPGMDADISILELLSGSWHAVDTVGKTLVLDRLIVPRACVKGGSVIPSDPVATPAPAA
jgi:dihydroorotase